MALAMTDGMMLSQAASRTLLAPRTLLALALLLALGAGAAALARTEPLISAPQDATTPAGSEHLVRLGK